MLRRRKSRPTHSRKRVITRTSNPVPCEQLESRIVMTVGVHHQVLTEWSTGYQAEIRLVNNTDEVFQDWKLEFDYSHEITSLWNARVASNDNGHYTLLHPSWGTDLQPGQTVTIGYLGARNGPLSDPQNYRLNGRPIDGDPGPELPQFVVEDVQKTEGDSGQTTVYIPVKLDRPAVSRVEGELISRNGTAVAGSDYDAISTSFQIEVGESEGLIPLVIHGDTEFEDDETIIVDVQNLVGAVETDLTADITIINDDEKPDDDHNNCADVEFRVVSDWGSGFTGELLVTNRGQSDWNEWIIEFDFSHQLTSIWNAELNEQLGQKYTIQNASWNGTVRPGATVSFGFTATPGTDNGPIQEPRDYRVNGHSCSGPRDPQLTVDDIQVLEGDSGITTAEFTVSLDGAAEELVTVDFSTADRSAIAGTDYVATSGQLEFAPGDLTRTIEVDIIGDDVNEVHESFVLLLSGAMGAVIEDGEGMATIRDDDDTPPPPPGENAWPDRFFAPYIDFTGWPPFDFVEAAEITGVSYYNLGFVVADPVTSEPSWGGYYDVDSAYRLDEIEQLRGMGGDVMVSFGGAANTELAVAITDPNQLTDAYQSVIDTYSLTTIDFDIEGAWVADRPSIDRRSTAISMLQQEADLDDRALEVFYTLPVLPEGLTADGVYVLQSALDAGVEINGVNIMAMDYGRPGTDMGQAAIQAATSLHEQLDALYTDAGTPLSDAQLWKLIGVTPMIGVNDTGERFYTEDAWELLEFAEQQDLRMLSHWSIQRDNQGTLDQLSIKFSGVPQAPFEFSMILNNFTNSGGSSGSVASTSAFLTASDSGSSDSEANDGLSRDSNALLSYSADISADALPFNDDQSDDSRGDWQIVSVDSVADEPSESEDYKSIDRTFADADLMLTAL